MIEQIVIASGGLFLGVAVTAAYAERHIRDLKRANRAEIARTDTANRKVFALARKVNELQVIADRDEKRKAQCRAAAAKGRATQNAFLADDRKQVAELGRGIARA